MESFKFAEPLVEETVIQINIRVGSMLAEVITPLRLIVSDVENNPETWKGRGAEEFVVYMEDVIKILENIRLHIGNLTKAIDKGAERTKLAIDVADKEAMKLLALFSGI